MEDDTERGTYDTGAVPDLCEGCVWAHFLLAADQAGTDLALVDMMGARLAHPETWTCRCCGFAVAHREPRAAPLALADPRVRLTATCG